MSGFTREAMLAFKANVASPPKVEEKLPVRPTTAAALKEVLSRRSAESAPPAISSNNNSVDSDEEFEGGQLVPEHVKGTRGVQIRNACVTYYPPFPGDFAKYLPASVDQLLQFQLRPSSDAISFYVSCLEVAPTTGLLHGHLYIEFTRSMTILQIQKLLGVPCQVFMRKGTAKQAIDYVYKRDKYQCKNFTTIVSYLSRMQPDLRQEDLFRLIPHSQGVQKKQGERADLDRYVEMAMEGVMRCEFLARERGAGLRYIRYFDNACSAVDGTDRNDIARNNKRIAYESYVRRCEETGEVPCRFFEFNVELDFKSSSAAEEYRLASMAEAFDQRDEEDQEAWQAAVNQKIAEGDLPEGTEVKKEANSDQDKRHSGDDDDE